MTERVKLLDEDLKADLAKVDWGKHLQYGTIEILVQDGKPVMVTKKETTKIG